MEQLQKYLAMKIKLILITICFFSLFTTKVFSFGNTYGLSPFYEWKTLESKHFKVTYPDELEELAEKTLFYYEECHSALSKQLKWTPRHKVQVLVVDNTDFANGLSSASLRFGMILMLTPPESWFNTSYYENWLKLLVIHEYTHYLNMDPTTGWTEALRWIFGDIIRPNSLWPTWMLEGLAVYNETKFTNGGRGRSSYYEMVLRTAVKNDSLGYSDFITLDKVNGPNPYFPGGSTPYLFGYQLMNQVSRFDPENPLGEMSYRSASRIPFFINSNLKNITGKNWGHFWNDFADETEIRMKKQLKKIKSSPVTKPKMITNDGYYAFGASISPNGKWLAYRDSKSNERPGVYLINLKSLKQHRIEDQILGSSLGFTPDSNFLIYSSARKDGLYKFFSDLKAYHLKTKKISWITKDLRAKDPSLSANGKKITFEKNTPGKTNLAIADIRYSDNTGKVKLSNIKTLYEPKILSRVSHPRFTPQGDKIVFSFHDGENFKENLVQIDIKTKKTRVLIDNKKFNRYPTYSPTGELYFVSDLSGVDNLYLYRNKKDPKLVTNFTTGMWFPVFHPKKSNEIYASVFSISGWNIGKFKLNKNNTTVKKVKVSPPPAPKATPVKLDQKKFEFNKEDYRKLPTLLPRVWAPLLLYTPGRFAFGATVVGFDALDFHRYLVLLSYDTLVQQVSGNINYTNRSFGPNINLYYSYETQGVLHSGSNLDQYQRKLSSGVSISYPFLSTWSSFTPALSWGVSRTLTYQPINGSEPSSKSSYIPIMVLNLNYNNIYQSRLGITPEQGLFTQLSLASYFDSLNPTWKALYTYKHNFNLGNHTVLAPSFTGAYTSKQTGSADSNILIEGAVPSFASGVEAKNLDSLQVKGYPGRLEFTRWSVIQELEFKIPTQRIFRGFNTHPFFLKNSYAFAFFENTYYHGDSGHGWLPSVGAGYRITSQILLHVPITFSLELHQGLNASQGGKTQIFFTLFASGMDF